MVRTKNDLKLLLVNGHLVTGADFTDLVDSLKAVQTSVSDPAANGSATAFIASISQDAEGVITVTKKYIDFSGYQTVSGMANYQQMDLQQTGAVNVDETGVALDTDIQHDMKHYPTVRLLDASGKEVRPTSTVVVPFVVTHPDNMNVKITLAGALNTPGASYTYILD